jgi:transposase
VRPYSRGQKNDFRDAEAIAETVQRPTMKFVATKTAEQLDLQALHRVRERLVSQRTGIINQIRAFLLERGVAVRQGLTSCALSCHAFSPHLVMLCHPAGCASSRTWPATGAGSMSASRAYPARVEALARQDKGCERLMTVPGIGPSSPAPSSGAATA